MSANTPTSRRAYTLVELLVVIVILGIIGAIVVPSLLNAGTLTIQAASRRIITDILLAQNEAVAVKASRRVVFTVAQNKYAVTDSANVPIVKQWMGGNYVVNFSQGNQFRGVHIDSADFSGQSWFAFDELGAPSSGGTVDVSADGSRYRITVTPFTGRVTVAPITGG